MRVFMILIAALVPLFVVACGSISTKEDVPVAHGSYLLSAHTLEGGQPAVVRMGGKVFHISTNTITWEPGGSAPLTAGWGLMELEESPVGVVIKLDGVKVAEVAN